MKDEAHINIAKRLREIRLEREWTWRQLAAVCGVSLASVHAIAKGKQRPNELTMQKLRRALPGLLDTAA